MGDQACVETRVRVAVTCLEKWLLGDVKGVLTNRLNSLVGKVVALPDIDDRPVPLDLLQTV